MMILWSYYKSGFLIKLLNEPHHTEEIVHRADLSVKAEICKSSRDCRGLVTLERNLHLPLQFRNVGQLNSFGHILCWVVKRR